MMNWTDKQTETDRDPGLPTQLPHSYIQCSASSRVSSVTGNATVLSRMQYDICIRSIYANNDYVNNGYVTHTLMD